MDAKQRLKVCHICAKNYEKMTEIATKIIKMPERMTITRPLNNRYLTG
jgi:hypothetical protein